MKNLIDTIFILKDAHSNILAGFDSVTCLLDYVNEEFYDEIKRERLFVDSINEVKIKANNLNKDTPYSVEMITLYGLDGKSEPKKKD